MRLTPTAVLWSLAAAGCFLAAPIRANAGTTGSLSGTVIDAKTRAPIGGASVGASSPTQSASAKTDSRGHFTLISLLPDTYVIAISKQGYESFTLSGISVFADSALALDPVRLLPALRTIGAVSSRSPLDLVKPGTTNDVYSVDPATTAAASVAGGGGSLNSAYSALAVLPGLFVPPNQQGVNQTVYIRGGYYDQIGYEYDGVPVNRSFDNYPGHSAATIGQQELQLYTGGGGADANATGLAGFINQVAKSGTYPGYAIFSARVGDPTFYHDLSGEISGATSNRLFTYYVGTSGFNQAYRYFDNFNGAGQISTFPNYGPSNQTTYLDFYPAVYPTCNKDLSNPLSYPSSGAPSYVPGCFAAMNPAYGNVSYIEGRDWVANFHVRLPHRGDGLADDIQFLYTNSAQFRQYYSGPNDAGYLPSWYADGTGALAAPPHWPDFLTFPSGTQFLSPANVTPIAYPFPGSPTNRCYNTPIPVAGSCDTADGIYSLLPSDYRDGRWDTASIDKLQYQKNLSSSAYLRIFGYTFYSDTDRSGASRQGIGSGFGVENYEYEVDSHTRGAELQFGDQFSSRNLFTASANFITATTSRYNNYNDYNDTDQQVSNLTNGVACFAYAGGYLQNGQLVQRGSRQPCNDPLTQGFFGAQTEGQTVGCGPGSTIPLNACQNGASWRITYTGNQGPLNTVIPKFGAIALQDQLKPNDKLIVNLGFRLERDEYDLANTNTPGKNFWFAAAQKEFCYDPTTLLPLIVPQPPQYASLIIPYAGLTCPLTAAGVQTVHPDGKDGHLLLSNVYNPTIVQAYPEPRAGATYTLDSDNVLRFSAGRYVQQPQAYEVQYNSKEENLASQLIGFLPYGFTTPRHDSDPQYSNNFDFSLEHRFKGSDVSLKLTPYFRYATNQLYGVNTAESSASLNTGIESTNGLELELVKGDFKKNGLSLLFSYTYTASKEKWADFPGVSNNAVDLYNDYISQFNLLTKAGGGAPCYANSADDTPDPSCGPTSIRNPYYTVAKQPLYDRNAWYDTGLDYPYIVPNNFSFVANYRRLKLAFTPVVTLNQGASYGNPGDVIGIDPRTCTANQATQGFITATDPLRADYTSCNFAATASGNLYVPNPESGHFDGFGEFRQPWQLNFGLGVTYDVTPRASFNLSIANLYNRCFGGSRTAWTTATPPSSVVCGYNANPFYVDNFYNGSSPNDVVANGVPLNPYFAHSFVAGYADTNTYNYAMPLSMYLRFSLKL